MKAIIVFGPNHEQVFENVNRYILKIYRNRAHEENQNNHKVDDLNERVKEDENSHQN